LVDGHVDVLIVGAGISGVGTACHLTRDCPGKTFVILERREAIGGTWDLFRYPGIRSDSDMFTFGFGFRPWKDTKMVSGGTSIRDYVRATAEAYGIERHIKFGLRVVSAEWCSEEQRWTVAAVHEANGEPEHLTASFLMACTGYYDYDSGHRPEFPGEARFGGPIVHPQHWPAGVEYAGRKVVVIGSGATAVTLVPALAQSAGHVTMLQRSPTYIMSIPSDDVISAKLRRVLPDSVVYRLARARNIRIQRALYAQARARPDLVRAFVLQGVKRALGDTADIKHFTPNYDPWDQRLCFVPDGDLFKAIRSGRAEVVTDGIETFTETGIRLSSGEQLDADVIVTATGLNLQVLGGATLSVDGELVAVNQRMTYKGVLLEGIPNAALVFGYVNASWTLKADLAAQYVCRLLNHMDSHGYGQVVARAQPGDRAEGSILGALGSGYIRRCGGLLPRQGTHGPWKVTHDYRRDVSMLRRGSIDDGVLEFGDAKPDPGEPALARAAARG
jgi:cation diffusion facilitator CzcD-associated flavoprotein CzcO